MCSSRAERSEIRRRHGGQLPLIGRMNWILEFLTISELRRIAEVIHTDSLEARNALGLREDHFQPIRSKFIQFGRISMLAQPVVFHDEDLVFEPQTHNNR